MTGRKKSYPQRMKATQNPTKKAHTLRAFGGAGGSRTPVQIREKCTVYMHSYRLNFRPLAGGQHTNLRLSHWISQVLSSLAPTSSTMSTPKISTGKTER